MKKEGNPVVPKSSKVQTPKNYCEFKAAHDAQGQVYIVTIVKK
jgi:hypothetical protein